MIYEQSLTLAFKSWLHNEDPFFSDYPIAGPGLIGLERVLRRAYCRRHGCVPYSQMSWKYTDPPRCYRCWEICSKN